MDLQTQEIDNIVGALFSKAANILHQTKDDYLIALPLISCYKNHYHVKRSRYVIPVM
jgi:hypothetical protein